MVSMRLLATAAVAGLMSVSAAAQPKGPATDETAFRSLYKELVETDTSYPGGSCTLAAQRLAARFKAAGFADADVHLIVPTDHPKDGNPGRRGRLFLCAGVL